MVTKRMITIWNEDKKEYQWLICSEKLYNLIVDARNKLKEDYAQEPILNLKENHEKESTKT